MLVVVWLERVRWKVVGRKEKKRTRKKKTTARQVAG
jgi:hypothetical protein